MRTLKEAVGTAVERQRRRRLPGPLLLPGLCLPKALAPLLPIYLQGVLQVRTQPRSMLQRCLTYVASAIDDQRRCHQCVKWRTTPQW